MSVSGESEPYKQVPHTKYETEVASMLRQFSAYYDPKGPAEGHTNVQAKQWSCRITGYVNVNWRESFMQFQFPFIQRKGFPQYNPRDPKGN